MDFSELTMYIFMKSNISIGMYFYKCKRITYLHFNIRKYATKYAYVICIIQKKCYGKPKSESKEFI